MSTPKDDEHREDYETMDESLYEDDLDYHGHWFEIWGED